MNSFSPNKKCVQLFQWKMQVLLIDLLIVMRLKCWTVSQEGNWLLAPCDERLPAVCRRESQNPIHHLGTWDEGCPEVGTWMHKYKHVLFCQHMFSGWSKTRKPFHPMALIFIVAELLPKPHRRRKLFLFLCKWLLLNGNCWWKLCLLA